MPQELEQWKERMSPGATFQLHTVHKSGWCHGNPLKTTKEKVKVDGKMVEVDVSAPNKLLKIMVHESALQDRFDLIGMAKQTNE